MFNSLIIVYLFAVFIYVLAPIDNVDIGYILKTGQYVVQNLQVPTHDIFSFSAAGAPWIAHYWFSGVLMYLVVHFLGFYALIATTALIAALTYWLVVKKFQLYFKDPSLALLLIFPTSILIFGFWSPRGQIFTNLFTGLFLFLIEKWRLQKTKIIPYVIPPLVVLWANLHAGVILGLAILGLWMVVSFIEARFDLTKIKTQVMVFFVSCLASLVNPWGYKLLTIQSYVYKDNAEFQSIFNALDNPTFSLFLITMILSLGFIIYRKVLYCRRNKTIDLWNFGIMLSAFLMPIFAIRHVVLVPLFILPLLAKDLWEFWIEIRPRFNKRKLYIATLAIGLMLIILRLPFIFGMESVNSHNMPVSVANFIREQGVAGPLFNSSVSGGWLIWQLWPGHRAYFDSRNDVYSSQIYDEYLNILKKGDGWQEIVNEKYKFNAFLINYRLSKSVYVQKTIGSLIDSLIDDLHFKLVYWDDVAVILVRDTKDTQEVINKYDYHLIRPFQNPSYFISPKDRLDAIAEVDRALSVSPDSTVLQDLRNRLLKLNGE